ncbi:hypothetical protein BASA50_003629 [Batrachochytrium salamandrivorans]|uniref:mRNA-decapping enzyme C-terminal domain-containing protein n=1 Tax=Batrachochytrium salamandrivorans TaxID=1357716 RepID=A0ABQ8FHZ8_9FUNG|nr:hypothetical protein BASA62_007264 [Batrachochytrium salamandrivorans]KAH6569887.1 hypothetical protein BASA60_008083 [Batrachochytrium salamandrivorans]KAH6598591.1 hypothetical protein BASA50_003629 [Batrachochytrium salamandrivorans]KAH6600768.1 hypothetical protein BASA61_002185 [Batrachochytrium salamandrivorans]KAH9276321.1 hypothetical protein BASA83_001009 [Batrachochytrium salamandrivorans]
MSETHVSVKSALNLGVLRRHDPLIESILATSSHVTVYNFEPRSQAWTKRGIEGTMFIFQRNSQPQFGFMIMNRLSTENLVVSLTSDLQFEMLGDYLIYRLPNDSIMGLWIFEPSDRQRLTSILSDMTRYSTPNILHSHDKPRPVSNNEQLMDDAGIYHQDQSLSSGYQQSRQYTHPQQQIRSFGDMTDSYIRSHPGVNYQNQPPQNLYPINQRQPFHSLQHTPSLTISDFWDGIDHMGPSTNGDVLEESEFYARMHSLVRDPNFERALFRSYQASRHK